jgi:hypothetical protein
MGPPLGPVLGLLSDLWTSTASTTWMRIPMDYFRLQQLLFRCLMLLHVGFMVCQKVTHTSTGGVLEMEWHFFGVYIGLVQTSE